jgi:putative membrane protein
MNRFNSLMLMLSAILIVQACSSNNSNQAGDGDSAAFDTTKSGISNPVDTVSNDMGQFMLKAASGGMMEVQLGEIAQQNAASSRVKRFGAMMVRDHSKANDELKALASSKNITIPASLGPAHQSHVDNLKKLTGTAFDEQYMDMMTTDHLEDISAFDRAANDGKITDAGVKAFAAKTLPILKMHSDSAQAISRSLKK